MIRTQQSKQQTTRRPSLLRDQRGLSTVEYIIILVLIAVGGLGLWKKLGEGVNERISGSDQTIRTDLEVPAPGAGGDKGGESP
ncbi:MAG: hypothetical protein H6715_00215 [Myxococcales bacterium]|nr:hypothetical protein [Myxococcales bacterium]MCB9707388.1 hypothetical protein [Myxococcales bacterium]